MKVTVDYDLCASTGSCVQTCPEVFEIRSDGYLYLLMEEIPPELERSAREAEELCPTGAIELIDSADPGESGESAGSGDSAAPEPA